MKRLVGPLLFGLLLAGCAPGDDSQYVWTSHTRLKSLVSTDGVLTIASLDDGLVGPGLAEQIYVAVAVDGGSGVAELVGRSFPPSPLPAWGDPGQADKWSIFRAALPALQGGESVVVTFHDDTHLVGASATATGVMPMPFQAGLSSSATTYALNGAGPVITVAADEPGQVFLRSVAWACSAGGSVQLPTPVSQVAVMPGSTGGAGSLALDWAVLTQAGFSLSRGQTCTVGLFLSRQSEGTASCAYGGEAPGGPPLEFTKDTFEQVREVDFTVAP